MISFTIVETNQQNTFEKDIKHSKKSKNLELFW